jgi:transcriptional regulator GlxA family with amidase domain
VKVDVEKRIIDHGQVITAGGFMAWLDVGLMLVDRFSEAPSRLRQPASCLSIRLSERNGI